MLEFFITKLIGSQWEMKNKALNRGGIYLKLYSYLQNRHGSSIAHDSTFKSTPCFPHGIKSIFISGGARIGDNCVLFQQVTIGSNTLIDSKGFGAPTIGDSCYIGAGAKIIGNVTIGDNVRVGANAVVFRDVPDNSLVVGTGKVIPKEQLNNRFYSYPGKWVYFDKGTFVDETNEANLDTLEGYRKGK